jgi:hypothetical protein
VWAALFALADASRQCRGTLVGFADPTLYSLAGQSQATYFNDVTSGNNDFTPSGNTTGMYTAAVGYDEATGLGSPKAAALVPALCRQAVKITYPGQVYTFYGQHVRMKLHATLTAGEAGPLRFAATRLPLGLHLNQATGVITGSVRQAGLRTVTLTASTASGTYGAIQFTWAVERRPEVTAAVAGSSAAPALAISAQAGAFEPDLHEVIIKLPVSIWLKAAAGTVKVKTASGRPLAHSARYGDHVLTVRLVSAQSRVRIVFPPGALRVRAELSGPVTVAVGTVDRLGGHLTLRRTLHGA